MFSRDPAVLPGLYHPRNPQSPTYPPVPDHVGPLGVGGMITLTFSLLSDNLKAWWLFSLPMSAISALFGASEVLVHNRADPDNLMVFGALFAGLFLIGVPLLLTASLLTSIGTLRGAALAWRGYALSLEQLARGSVKGFWSFIAYSILFALGAIPMFFGATLAGLLAAALPFGLGYPLDGAAQMVLYVIAGFAGTVTIGAVMGYLVMRLSLGSILVILEGEGPIEAFSRSWALMARSPSEPRWTQHPVLKLGVVLFIVGIVAAIPNLAISAIDNILIFQTEGSKETISVLYVFLSRLVQTGLGALLLPASMIVYSVAYLDRLVRHQGLDLKLKAEALEETAPPSAPTRPFGTPGL